MGQLASRRRSTGWPVALWVVTLWIPTFALGTVIHEALHALAVLLLGSHPVLVLRPWALALAPVSITGIHIQPVPTLDPTRQFLDNLLGPGVAAILFAAAALKLPGEAVRYAVIATALGLAFFAIIEPADVVLDGHMEMGLLTVPEFNYGVPLLLALASATYAARRFDTEPA